MATVSTNTINDLRDFMDRGNAYAGTQEIVNDLVYETLKELGTEYPYGDEISLFDGDDQFATVEDFANLFWDAAVEKILNVLNIQN